MKPRRPLGLAAILAAVLLLVAPARARAEAQPNTTFVILGVGGDLSTRKVLPSLMQLEKANVLPPGTRVVGMGTADVPLEQMRTTLRERIVARTNQPLDESAWGKLASDFRYTYGDVADPATFTRLAATLKGLDAERGVAGPRIIYLALPPDVFPAVLTGLRDAGLLDRDGPEVRLVVEKPFGTDLGSAHQLGEMITEFVGEERVYPIDHYLGKKAVRLFQALRLGDPRFGQAWNRRFIQRIDVRARESIGVEGRGDFYEKTGALRDMVQSHLLQFLALASMDQLHARRRGVAQAKVRAIEALEPITPKTVRKQVVRAQYDGYRKEVKQPASGTETYVKVKTRIVSGALEGVRVSLETGKGLDEKVGDIRVRFRALPSLLAESLGVPADRPATLTVTVDPEPVIRLRSGRVTHVLARGKEAFDPYAVLLADLARGDRSRFVNERQIEASWRFVDAIHAAWAKVPTPLTSYARGSRGSGRPARISPPKRPR